MTTIRPRTQQDLAWMPEILSREYPDKVAIIDAERGTRRTYAQFARRTSQVGDALWSIGVRPGNNFGLLMHNCAEFLGCGKDRRDRRSR
jgi:acyl-CoA synthetase (AMP-forming)/AMP-acid ligase II